MEDSEIIISGPEYSGPEYYGSIAEYMIPKIKAHPKDLILQVDCKQNETITAEDFLRQSLEVAEGLIKLGLKQGDVVISACSNSIRSHIAAMGVLFSGGTFAPIDQTLKTVELQHFMKIFQPIFIMCNMEKIQDIQTSAKKINIDSKIIVMDSTNCTEEFLGWEDIKTTVDVENYTPRKVEDPKKDIALLICSSGSTGLPKGVELSHYSVVFNFAVFDFSREKSFTELNGGFLLTSPLFWISGTILTINSCCSGQTRYIPKSTATEDVLQGIEKCKPSFLMLSPSSLLDLVLDPSFEKFDVSSVKVIFAGGAVLSPAIVTKVQNTWKNVTILNCYGLTEACGGITVGSVSENTNSIGKLTTEIKVKVVDLDTGKSLGPNKIGECRIKTKRVMNGYYKNEKATKEVFDEKGWLCTGDLVYYDKEDVFYIVGRIKETISYLNNLLSPVILESYIIGFPGVKDVAIVGVPHEKDNNHLRALVVKDSKYNITAEDIIESVKENFSAPYHLREGVQFVKALPRTEVGKLKRLETQKIIKDTKKQEVGFC